MALQNNTAELRKILNTVTNWSGGGGSDGGLETCTLKLVNNGGFETVTYFVHTLDADGNIVYIDANADGIVLPAGETVINNAVCGSLVNIWSDQNYDYFDMSNIELTNMSLATMLGYYDAILTFKIDASAGGVAVLELK